MQASGKTPKNDDWKKKYREPKLPDTGDQLLLPEGWVWAGIDQLADGSKHAIKAGPFGSSLTKASYVVSGYKIYVQEQVIRGDAFYGDYFIDRTKYQELQNCAVKPGDVLISLVGTAGRVLILPTGAPAGIINPRLIKISPHTSVRPKYLKLFLESPEARAFFRKAAHGETMDVLNLAIVHELLFPLPSTGEQDRIVAEAEDLFSVIEQQLKTTHDNLARADRLRQSILKHALEGKLVPQDPNHEPASALLERIKIARLSAKPRVTPTKRKQELSTMSEAVKLRPVIDVLRETKTPISPEELFEMSGHNVETIDEFYAALKLGIETGQITETRTGKDGVLLQAG